MIQDLVRDVENFPKEGITFKDISPLLANPKALSECIDSLAEQWNHKKITAIAGLDARGFIFGSLLAYKLQLPFVPVRKKGKLPGKTKCLSYELEYGQATIEIQENSFKKEDLVLIVDDLLATGGTAKATCQLVELLGATVAGCAFIIELEALKGRVKLKDYDTQAILTY